MSTSSVVYGFVYRQNTPAGWKGRRCRIVKLAPQRRDWLNKGEIFTGETLIGVQFEDGELQAVPRQSIVPVRSRMGWAALRLAANPPPPRMTRSEARRAWHAKRRGETV